MQKLETDYQLKSSVQSKVSGSDTTDINFISNNIVNANRHNSLSSLNSTNSLNPIEKEKLRHYTDIKFPTFDDKIIDTELSYEVTMESLFNDIHSSIHILLEYEKMFDTLFIEDKKNDILACFQTNNLNYLAFKLVPTVLRRHINLITCLIKLYDKKKDTEINEINKHIETDYEISESKIKENIMDSLVANSKTKLSKDQQTELNELMNKYLENENYILTKLRNHKTSITGMSVSLKFLKVITNKTIESLEIIRNNHTEENLVLFFYNVMLYITFLEH